MMLNQLVMVGRLVETPTIKEENERKVAILTLAIPRSYKNENGVYDTDFIDCIIYNDIAKNTCEYCKKGDIVGIKGRLQSRTLENEEGESKRVIEIVGERVTFLSSKKPNEEE